jgi:hypothetical protein
VHVDTVSFTDKKRTRESGFDTYEYERDIPLQIGWAYRTAQGISYFSLDLRPGRSDLRDLLRIWRPTHTNLERVRSLSGVPSAGLIADAMEAAAQDDGCFGALTHSAQSRRASRVDRLLNELREALEGLDLVDYPDEVMELIPGSHVAGAISGLWELAIHFRNHGIRTHDLTHNLPNNPSQLLIARLAPHVRTNGIDPDWFRVQVMNACDDLLLPRVERVVESVGGDIDGCRKFWIAHRETYADTRSLTDAYLITGGRDVHGKSLNTELGLLSPGGTIGSGLRAAISYCVFEAFTSPSRLPGTRDQIDTGIELLMANRVHVAMNLRRGPHRPILDPDMPYKEEEALAAVRDFSGDLDLGSPGYPTTHRPEQRDTPPQPPASASLDSDPGPYSDYSNNPQAIFGVGTVGVNSLGIDPESTGIDDIES